MNIMSNKKIGSLVVLVNLLIILFMMTSNEDMNIMITISILSSFIAIYFGYIILKQRISYNNLISLIINIFISSILLMYTIFG